ncbi:MAG: hypothetical protein CMG08_00120, partial [Candidatus Marinimicrobia bacterium]|nr:hypothetical protein [Candidatus Neomarinimicrobiota bacterium]
MSQGISIKRGANINLIGEAEKLLSEAQPSKTFALKPDNFFSLVPRLMVKVGESVAKGSPVFHAIQYLLGNLDKDYLTELRAYHGLQAYPSRTKDPDGVDFSTGSVGLGP